MQSSGSCAGCQLDQERDALWGGCTSSGLSQKFSDAGFVCTIPSWLHVVSQALAEAQQALEAQQEQQKLLLEEMELLKAAASGSSGDALKKESVEREVEPDAKLAGEEGACG